MPLARSLQNTTVTEDPTKYKVSSDLPCVFYSVFSFVFFQWIPSSGYVQDSRPLEEYICKFLIRSQQATLDRWTLVDCFWGGLDEGIASLLAAALSGLLAMSLMSREMALAPDHSQKMAPDQLSSLFV